METEDYLCLKRSFNLKCEEHIAEGKEGHSESS